MYSFESSSLAKERRAQFGFILDVDVFVFTIELDEAEREDFDMFGSACWATLSADPNSTIRYNFILTRGYVFVMRG